MDRLKKSWFGKLLLRVLLSALNNFWRIVTHFQESFLPYFLRSPVLRFKADGWNEKIYGSTSLGRLVVIFGGYLGDSVQGWLSRFPDSRIIVFEPIPEYAAELRRRFDGQNVKICEFGVGSAEETRSFIQMGDATYQQPVRRKDISSSSSVGMVNVRFKPVKDLSSILGASQNIDVLEVNIEGGEYELLPLLFQENLLQNVKSAFIQFHDVGRGTRDKVARMTEMLSKSHVLDWRYPLVWDHWKLSAGDDTH